VGTRKQKSELNETYALVIQFIALWIRRPNRRLYIDHAPYVHDILEEFLMSNTTPVSIPMDPNEQWEPKKNDIFLDTKETRVYQRAIDRLMYLMLGTRPDIAYAVCKLA